MKYCQKCGNALDVNAVVCTKCGCAVPQNNPSKEKSSPSSNKITIGKILACIAIAAITVLVIVLLAYSQMY